MDIVTYHKNQVDAFQNYLFAAKKEMAVEDIHQLRVKIKELRALWKLLDIITNNKDLHRDLRTIIKPLFKKAGKVREIQVNMHLLSTYKQQYLCPVKEKWQQDLVVVKEDLKDYLPYFENETLIKALQVSQDETNNLSRTEIQRGANILIHQKMLKSNELIPLLPNDQKMHKIRIHQKVIKEIFSILSILDLTKGLKTFSRDNHSLCRQLGDWHDMVDLHLALLAFDHSNLTGIQQKQLFSFMDRLKHRKDAKAEQLRIRLVKYLACNYLVIR